MALPGWVGGEWAGRRAEDKGQQHALVQEEQVTGGKWSQGGHRGL